MQQRSDAAIMLMMVMEAVENFEVFGCGCARSVCSWYMRGRPLIVARGSGGELLGLHALQLLHRQTALVELVELLLAALDDSQNVSHPFLGNANAKEKKGRKKPTFCCSLCSVAASSTAAT